MGPMPHPQLLVALTLGLLVAALSIAARRLRIATPILMLTGGALLSVGGWLFLCVAFATAHALAPLVRRLWT